MSLDDSVLTYWGFCGIFFLTIIYSIDLTCSSQHAFRRTVPLVLQALVHSTTADNKVTQDLAHLVCRLVHAALSHHPSLTTEYRDQWRPILGHPNNNKPPQDSGVAQALFWVACHDKTLWTAAIPLGFDLLGGPSLDEWSNQFVTLAFQGDNLPRRGDLQGVLAPFLEHTAKEDEWPTEWLDALLLKSKANPESGLDCLLGFVRVGCTNNATIALPWSTSRHDEFLVVLTKHLQSTQPVVRDMAGQILACAAHDPASLVSQAIPALLDYQSSKATSMTAPQRIVVYSVWAQWAQQLLDDTTGPVDESLEGQLSPILTAICTLLGKEGKTAVTSKEEGMTALWYWWRVAKKNSPNNNNAKTLLQPVLGFLIKPLSNSSSADTIAIVGHFLKTITDEDAVEAMAMDLFGTKNAALDKGLDGIVTSAMAACTAKKPSASVDGLIVVYLGLVYAMAVGGSAQAWLLKAWKGSPNFVWAAPMVEGVTSANATTSSLIRLLLPRVLALAAKWTGDETKKADVPFKVPPVARALSACITHPYCDTAQKDEGRKPKSAKKKLQISPCSAIATSVKTVLTYQPKVAMELVGTLWSHVNHRANEAKELIEAFNAAQQAREEEATVGESAAMTWKIDSNAVRRVTYQPLSSSLTGGASVTPKILAQILTLMHVGSSLRDDGHQRNNLRRTTLDVLKSASASFKDPTFASSFASHVAEISCSYMFTWAEPDAKGDASPVKISDVLHRGALSLLMSLGGIGGTYLADLEMGLLEEDKDGNKKDESETKASEFASVICTKEIPKFLRDNLARSRDEVEALSADKVDLLLSPPGTLHGADSTAKEGDTGKAVSGKGKKSRGGFNAKEDEEWEAQLKKEIAEKKKKEKGASGQGSRTVPLSAEDKKKVALQDEEREKLSGIVYGEFVRALAATRQLTISDIEVGNACLPIFTDAVLSTTISECPAFKAIRGLSEESLKTLVALAGAAYEIPEDYAPQLATALTLSCKRKPKKDEPSKDDESTITITPLPNPCSSAACVMHQLEESQGALTGNSFVFVFPVIQAALTGPRTTQGCEGALRVLEWHTRLLAGEEADPVVVPLRKAMSVSVLELMKHDRAQTFSNPSPSESLVACFRADADASGGPALSTSELSPLLDDRGALGGKVCRISAMLALRQIAQEYEGLIKKNPLIENRIWLNCFDENEEIRNEARRAWKAVHGEAVAEGAEEDLSTLTKPPSLMYAAPLLPLLSNADKSIASAASDAYAQGMAMHPKSVSKNIQKLCNSYIDSFPSSSGEKKKAPTSAAAFPAALPKKTPAAPTKKKPISLGLPKKKTAVKNSALSVAGIGKAGKKKKSSALTSALLKPKQERTLEHTDLASQFQTGIVQATKEDSKDSPEKISVRIGILSAFTALTKATDLEMDIPTLTSLTSFLMAYGIAESDETVKTIARNTLRDVVASNGSSDEAIAFLLPHLEDVLKKGLISDEKALGALSTEKIPRDVDACDRRKEGAVVALGSVALHLKGPENADKIDSTVDSKYLTVAIMRARQFSTFC